MTNLKQIKQLAEETWEGCDGCDENDKNFWINGFITGYMRRTPDEISDEEIEKEASKIHGVGYYAFSEGAKWYKEQLKKDLE